MIQEHLDALFTPRSIVVVGASATPGKVGHVILDNLIRSGFSGRIAPVNPHADTILGLPAFRKIADVGAEGAGPVDLAIICIPARQIPQALEELAALPIRAAVVISAGFKEAGSEGWLLESELVRIARRHSIALLGPNSLGLINTRAGLNATFAASPAKPGNIGFFSQSGALCIGLLDWAAEHNIGFSTFISTGNKAVLDESHYLRWLADDPDTRVIAGYIESIEHGHAFLRIAHDTARKKPIILLKAGRTSTGSKAASSHTGAMTGKDMTYEAAFKQAGIIRAETIDELFSLAEAFASQKPPKRPRLVVVSNAGGPGILAADACEAAHLSMPPLSSGTVNALKEALPPFAALFNPVDIIGDATANRFRKALDIVLKDDVADAVLAIAAPTGRQPLEEVARQIIEASRDSEKSIFTCMMGGALLGNTRQNLRQAGIPCFDFPEQAVAAIGAMARYAMWKEQPLPVEISYRSNQGRAEEVLEKARQDGLTELTEFDARELLKAYELPLPETRLARSSDEAVAVAKQIGFPVVVKIASPDILHKSDVGGVATRLGSPEEVRQAFHDITARVQRTHKDAYITGCMVQAMAPEGSKEVIVGFKRDRQFGPLILFGLGGIYVEVLRDVSARLAPLSLESAAAMPRELRTYPILRGIRGEKGVDLKAIEDILLIMSQIATDFPQISEAEFNPVMVNENGATVVDARIILQHENSHAGRGASRQRSFPDGTIQTGTLPERALYEGIVPDEAVSEATLIDTVLDGPE